MAFTAEDILGEFADAHYYGKGSKTLEDVYFRSWQRKRVRDKLSHQKRLLYQPGYWEAQKAKTRRSVAKWRVKNKAKISADMKAYNARPEVKARAKEVLALRLADPVALQKRKDGIAKWDRLNRPWRYKNDSST